MKVTHSSSRLLFRGGTPLKLPQSLWLHRLWRWYASLAAGGLVDFARQNLGGSAVPIVSAHHKALAGWQAYACLRPRLRLRFALHARSTQH